MKLHIQTNKTHVTELALTFEDIAKLFEAEGVDMSNRSTLELISRSEGSTGRMHATLCKNVDRIVFRFETYTKE